MFGTLGFTSMTSSSENVSSTMPVLHLKKGKHLVRVEMDGMKTYREAIEILGEPNHQVLNVMLMQ
jgi:hypothetical protein